MTNHTTPYESGAYLREIFEIPREMWAAGVHVLVANEPAIRWGTKLRRDVVIKIYLAMEAARAK